MSRQSPAVVHDTVAVERRFAVPPGAVFSAIADVDQRRRWHFPGAADWVLAEMTQDFRIGGAEHARFGPRDAPVFWNRGWFLDIVEDARIVSAGTMHEGDMPISSTLCTFEIMAVGKGSRLVVTDQSAFFDGREQPEQRKSGWGQVMVRLEALLGRKEAR